jgi:hypothetical protein
MSRSRNLGTRARAWFRVARPPIGWCRRAREATKFSLGIIGTRGWLTHDLTDDSARLYFDRDHDEMRETLAPPLHERGLQPRVHRQYVAQLLDGPEQALTPKGHSKLWQIAVLEAWLQTHGI